ncbi:MAG TPA: relaxase/mobilization nuclease domain-containing protein [Hanamia sp.]|nr:relaxase/mobilization nuclease domain-containing protein [Hanamia sp.]
MVAKITTPKRLIAALNYNEIKVSQGKAECLQAVNFLKNATDMNFYQKLEGFERLNELNDRAQTKTLHVSLNFDPSEKLPADKLLKIASEYMEKIGFGEQPFLIYKHNDAGHPHIHIVTTTIRDDGSRINTHNIGRNQSEKARKEIEKKFNLVRAENQKPLLKQKIHAVNAEIIIYGKTETKRAITNVVNAVWSTYKYSSLPEFNAILKQYNVLADRGKEDGRIYKNRGLVFRVLDTAGNKVGIPVKASSINSHPTLDKLEKIFSSNKIKKEPFKQYMKSTLDEIVAGKPAGMNALIKLLAQKNIYTVLRQNSEGRIYGITFVDNKNKVVFNGSNLGKDYSAAHLQNKLFASTTVDKIHYQAENSNPFQLEKSNFQGWQISSQQTSSDLMNLLAPKQQQDLIPYQLRKKKRKRKKKNIGL